MAQLKKRLILGILFPETGIWNSVCDHSSSSQTNTLVFASSQPEVPNASLILGDQDLSVGSLSPS